MQIIQYKMRRDMTTAPNMNPEFTAMLHSWNEIEHKWCKSFFRYVKITGQLANLIWKNGLTYTRQMDNPWHQIPLRQSVKSLELPCEISYLTIRIWHKEFDDNNTRISCEGMLCMYLDVSPANLRPYCLLYTDVPIRSFLWCDEQSS